MNILLADDDQDDCLLFKDALEELQLLVQLTMVHDGEALIRYLERVSPNLPHALFLDLNMPRKNGFQCLAEIKKQAALKTIPVIIYSTSYEEEIANILYQTGAHYYIRKPSNFEELKNLVNKAILLVKQNKVASLKENFYINKLKAAL